MKKNQLILSILLLILLCVSCSKGSDPDPDPNPGEESPYWSDGYRQHQLNGRVKTVKEIAEDDIETGSYTLLEYNAQGCLIKQHNCETNGTFSGLTL